MKKASFKKSFLYRLGMIIMMIILLTLLKINFSFAQTMATNPIIWADVPDPDLLRVGDTYYMSSTTMYFNPGIPIMKSKDLVNWSLVNYCYPTLASTDALNLNNGMDAYGGGTWASSINYHNGTYYVSSFSYTTGKTYIFQTTDIENGPWTTITLNKVYHDHSLFFDDDGKVYLAYGNDDIWLTELKPDLTGEQPGGVNKIIISKASSVAGTSFILTAEGTHLQKINGTYYVSNICWPNGKGRTQIIHRASTVAGTYTGQVAFQSSIGSAQGEYIDTPDGKWYAMFFHDQGSVGRVPDLMPVTWSNGWPVVGVNGQVPATLDIPKGAGTLRGIIDSDEFSTAAPLKLQWQWNHNPNNSYWSMTQRSGFLRLTNERTDANVLRTTNTLTQRAYGPKCTGYIAIDVSGMKDGDYAGLLALQNKYGFVGVKMSGTTKNIVMVNGAGSSGTPTEVSGAQLSQNTIYLRIDMDFTNKTDKAYFYYSLDGATWQSIGSTLQMTFDLAHFTGYRFGLFSFATKSFGGYVDFDFFRVGANITEASNVGPLVSFTSPASGTTFAAGSTIGLSATATTSGGSITDVKFYNGTTLLGSDNTAPYSFSWTNVPAGSYTLRAVATDNQGKTSEAAVTITVIAPPIATITAAGTTTFCAGGSVVLNASTGTGYTYQWKKDGGSIANATASSYTATQSGSYTVVVSANGQTATSTAVSVTVNALPNAPVVSSPVTYCQNTTTMPLTAAGINLKWYSVSSGGTPSSASPTPSAIAAGTTNYYVSQTVNGCESPRATMAVTVNALPVITPYVQINGGAWLQQNTAQLCAGGTVVLGPQPLSATGWSWTGPDGFTASSREISLTTISTAQGGVYTATYTSNGCMAKQTFNITVNSLPAAPTVISKVTYCQNAIAGALTATGSNLKWYTVSSGGTVLATAPTPLTTTAGTMNYYVSQTTDGCESSRAMIAVTINSLPEAVITPSGPTTINPGSNVVLSANSDAGLSYKWYNGTIQVGTGNTYTATSTGNYTVEVTNASGCKENSSVVTVTVNGNQAPLVIIDTPSDNATFIAPATVAITATATDTDGTIAKVEFYNGSTLLGSDASAPYSFSWSKVAAGSYQFTAKATDNNGTVSASQVVTITVTANQPSVITINSPVNNSTVSGGGVTINVTATDTDGSITLVEYLDNGSVIGTGTTAPYTYTADTLTPGNHVITVRVTDSNGGVTTSDEVTVVVNTPTEIQSISGMEVSCNVYPNPSNGALTIETAIDLTDAKVAIINVLGEEVQLPAVVNGKGASIDVSGLTKGTYVLIVKQGNAVLRKKIIVTK